MELKELIEGLPITDCKGNMNRKIDGIAYDSRKVTPGDLFVAIKGYAVDGHDFVRTALQKGATAVVLEADLESFHAQPDATKKESAPTLIQVPDSREALARIAKRFYGEPYEGMRLIGITGTNGKTTTSYLLESILVAAHRCPGVIGTITYRMPGQTWEAGVTTPESLDLMRTLRTMGDGGVTDVIMEVSSHALDQGRTRECPFRVAVFTNISRDHLDYHRSMEAYFEAKARLFKDLARRDGTKRSFAVLNLDDPMGGALKRATKAPVMTYGMQQKTDVRAEDVKCSKEGMTATLHTPEGSMEIRSRLMGDFNMYNIMAAATAALALGVPLRTISSGIDSLGGVPGRMERVPHTGSGIFVVDYAHTPDALSKAIQAMRKHITGRVITVFGCGGDRDRGKRVEMGRIAGRFSDVVVITSDNPRTEDPLAITEEIEKGVIESGLKDYRLELDRKRAISLAARMAEEEDGVLIAGKGHETYQIIGGEKRPFDDRVVAANAASDRSDHGIDHPRAPAQRTQHVGER
ncbi:MAG: UDP-N-acetylmuramoyl-L-alanyl-D-glutamate--2,6-diaminopimelate ligase [Deltaproteobacteria bacterium]